MNKRIAKLAIAATAALGSVAGVAATPAHASSAVSACFTEPGYGWARQPVQLVGWNGRNWTLVRSGTTNANGCATFLNTPTDRHLSIRAYKYLTSPYHGTITFDSSVTRWTPTGSGGHNLGTFSVGSTCTWGSYGRCAGLY